MLKLGIYAPYDQGETTAMALALARWAEAQGWTVQWLARRRADGVDVDSRWSPRIRSLAGLKRRRIAPSTWAAGFDAVVWFELSSGLMYMARGGFDAAGRRLSRTRHVLVPDAFVLQRSDLPALRLAHRIVVSTAGAAAVLKSYAAGFIRRAVVSCEWPAGVAVQSLRPDSTAPPTVVMPVDAATWRRYGPDLADLACALARRLPGQFMLALPTVPNRRVRPLLDRGIDDTKGRLVVTMRRWGQDCRRLAFRRHDWVILTGARTRSGLWLREARACGCVPIAWNIEPYRGTRALIRNRIDGLTVPCRTIANFLHCQAAVLDPPALAAMRDIVAAAVTEKGALARLRYGSHETAEAASDRARDFEDFWAAQLTPGELVATD